ncbi:MAG: hypothetical protein G01um101424_117 [Parcubacteria group bacterium Gr01-1014_24]|nr:MAG: hypothetical protein G01um101424_117 [Parcubacteria group bacterium Gr01-1014_24]
MPKELQEAINAFDWVKVTEELGEKYKLSESELNDFQVETLLVLVGFTDLNFYATAIENRVGITKDDAKKMADEALEKIFTPIADKITEKIKEKTKNKNPSPEQTLNFILSGGDYSAFMEQRENQAQEAAPTNKPINPPSLADIKAKLLIDNK